MKFTLSWLKAFLDTDADLATIDKTLTAIGLEVEGITDASATLADFTVAEILEAEQHPDADKLKLCRVKSDEGELQIVCGAANARAGLKVALAKIGTVIPNGGFKIKKSKIRGVESCGMLCSASELELGEDSAGIIELPEDAIVGQPIADALGLNDPLIDIAITPNRGDCLGVYGIARDLAAAGLGTLKPLTIPEVNAKHPSSIAVTIEDEHCPQFIGCDITGVKNGPSPDWLQQKLRAIGLRPISTLVDITNYFTFTYGRPLHVYDVDKLNGNITVRKGEKGESFDALNDKSYTLAGGECVIADDKGMLGLGGVVGGESSGVDENTRRVFLECAWFDPIHIAEVGRHHEILSDARFRFERTVDPAFVEDGARLAIQMIAELCGGEPSELVHAGNTPEWRREIPFDPAFTNALGGVSIPEDKQKDILTSLGFTFTHNMAMPPSWRPDVEGRADLAEEVLRIHGYDAVDAVPMPKPAPISTSTLSAGQERRRMVTHLLASRGLCETYSWAFLSDEAAGHFGGQEEALRLRNPISAELGVMRPSLIPNLLDGLSRNAARGQASLGLFEVGPQFSGIDAKGQQTIACAARMGDYHRKGWQGAARPVDCFDIKADALAVIAACGLDISKCNISRDVPDWYHPGRSGAITLGPKNILAYFGEIHPLTLQAHDCDHMIVACEVMLDAIPLPKKKNTPALRCSDLQPVERDFAFVMAEDIPAETLLNAIAKSDNQLIADVHLFDLYQGKGVEDGRKSLAVSIRLQPQNATLTDQEIDAASQKIIAAAEKVGATLR